MTYKTARDKKKLETRLADLEKEQNQDNYAATTSLSIQTIERSSYFDKKQKKPHNNNHHHHHNSHHPNDHYQEGARKSSEVNASENQFDFNTDQYSPKSATTLYSPFPCSASPKHYFDSITAEDVFYSSSSEEKKKGDVVTSVSKVVVDSSDQVTFPSNLPSGEGGIITTTKDEPSSSKDNIYSMEEHVKEQQIKDNSDLLSLNENENEEEYYNRMKSKYEGSAR